MIVYGSSLSPFVRKALVFAAEKQIEVQQVQAFGTAGPPEFFQASPFGKIPALQDGDFLLSDSTAIVTYFDALKPDPNLIPLEPKARARTIWWEEFADTVIMAQGQKIFFNRVVAPRFLKMAGDAQAADTAAEIELPKLLDYLEGQVPASGFLVEDRFTLADIAVASPFATLRYADCPVDCDRYPKTAAYLTAIFARPSFAGLLAREEAFIARTA
ncbi:glutathione S-transferase family protein [Phenylobacterium deserti]|uniref:glutathione transferase n=1 Tax=Phenylobacterium deserti TaxID=1914756 RepID=A0A328AWQ2_9CAUL|nr:glutathione S-transferase family protein [Phenylobacterium deserti]RAK58004.1 glutathione S-transferase family protein [Phenylobacterium deserti]